MSKILSIAKLYTDLNRKYVGETFRGLSFNNSYVDAGIIGVDDITHADTVVDNTAVRFGLTKDVTEGDIFFYNPEQLKFTNKNIDEYISAEFEVPYVLTDLQISDAANTGQYLTSDANGNFSFASVSYSSLTDHPFIPDRLTDLSDFEDGDTSNTVLHTDANGVFSFKSLSYEHLVDQPSIPATLTDLSILDSTSNTYLTTNGGGLFSFETIDYTHLSNQPSIPSVLTDLSISDGSANMVLTTDGAGFFSFEDIDYNNLTNTPNIPTGGSDTYEFLTTDSEGNLLLSSINYNNVVDTPSIPSSLLDLGIVDGAANTVLTTDANGNFTFVDIHLGNDYNDLANKPTIPVDLFDLGVDVNVVANSFLSTDGNGEFYFANIQYSHIQGLPFIPTKLTELNIEDGETANLVLTTDANGSFTFSSVNYSDLQNTPDEEIANTISSLSNSTNTMVTSLETDMNNKMAILEEEAFINSIIFG